MELYLDHERLDVYRFARQLNREVAELVALIPRGHGESIDNLIRAAKSVSRNIAEGAGKWHIADKTKFYRIARGSATECAASLDELVDYGITTEENTRRPKQTAMRIIAMLIAMIRSIEPRGRDMGT
ncbi:MAG TPA: four helix bundle protein [Longimicrobiales bacterium]|nr:four helix bundle protein [Longimicrobiales bacterium]